MASLDLYALIEWNHELMEWEVVGTSFSKHALLERIPDDVTDAPYPDRRVVVYKEPRQIARTTFFEPRHGHYQDGEKLLAKAKYDRETCKATLSSVGVGWFRKKPRCENKAKYNGYCGIHKKEGESNETNS